ncbi:WD40/YVTN/BNR-like repeat-containing protein [Halomarina salina]|uniref:WD40/YVTN/BNR-like repeat-containing protein n=1 Tax=Halomarina salina TaxID=1872699 RepID=A0ABD5RPY9_9EURY|nr:glycosyl hydrolase [Halomarina salina]
MKLGGTVDDVVYCTEGTTVGRWAEETGFQPRGTLPVPDAGPTNLPFSLTTRWPTRRLLELLTGSITTTNVWPLGDDALLATADRWLFRSTDGGRSWRVVRDLPDSSGPMGVLPTSVCVTDDAVYLAEYPLGDDPARVLVSHDRGESWSTFHERTDVRHFHSVATDPYSGALWGTTGDAEGECIVGRFDGDRFETVGRGGQDWRAVELAFTESAVVWGVDSAYLDSVGLFRLDRDRFDRDGVEPERVGETDAPVFYAETLTATDETWVVLSTAAEAGVDSTAPASMRRNTAGRTARVLAASERTGFEQWHELFAFGRRRTVSEHVGPVPTTGAYVFLGVAPDGGLLVNPFNTSAAHGDVLHLSPAAFDDLVGGHDAA